MQFEDPGIAIEGVRYVQNICMTPFDFKVVFGAIIAISMTAGFRIGIFAYNRYINRGFRKEKSPVEMEVEEASFPMED